MFKRIADEMCSVNRNIGREKVFAMAPAYLVATDKEDEESLNYSAEQLMLLLEKEKLFSEQTDDYFTLTVEYGVPEEQVHERLGLVDEFGTFKSSLEQWICYLNLQHQVREGIILIQIDWQRELMTERAWWKRFFRQMNRYKSDFLFLFYTGEKDAAQLQEWIGRKTFCCRLETRKLQVADYVRTFKRGLEKIEFSMDKKGEEVLVKLLEQYKDKMNGCILKQWQQELIWDYLLEEQPEGQKNRIFLAEYLTEESLTKHFKSHHNTIGIGFEV